MYLHKVIFYQTVLPCHISKSVTSASIYHTAYIHLFIDSINIERDYFILYDSQRSIMLIYFRCSTNLSNGLPQKVVEFYLKIHSYIVTISRYRMRNRTKWTRAFITNKYKNIGETVIGFVWGKKKLSYRKIDHVEGEVPGKYKNT